MTGRRNELLEQCETPPGFEAWMDHFLQLRTGENITHQEIVAFCSLYSIRMLPIEVSAILAMDRAASSTISEIMKEDNASTG